MKINDRLFLHWEGEEKSLNDENNKGAFRILN